MFDHGKLRRRLLNKYVICYWPRLFPACTTLHVAMGAWALNLLFVPQKSNKHHYNSYHFCDMHSDESSCPSN